MQLVDIVNIELLGHYTVKLRFSDDTIREVDLWPYIEHGPIFAPLRDEPGYFQRAVVRDGTITWPNNADIDPNVLYDSALTPANWESAQASNSTNH